MEGITRINMHVLYLNGLRPCEGLLQQLVPAYKKAQTSITHLHILLAKPDTVLQSLHF